MKKTNTPERHNGAPVANVTNTPQAGTPNQPIINKLEPKLHHPAAPVAAVKQPVPLAPAAGIVNQPPHPAKPGAIIIPGKKPS